MKSVYFCVYLSKKSYPVVVAATGFSLPCVDRKDAFKALKVKNLLFFKLSNGTHILSHTSIKLFA